MIRGDRRKQVLHGFRPTQSEVETLSRFGDVTHVSDLVSTKVCLRNVAQDDITQIAHLPSVAEVSRMPSAITPNTVDASDVVSNSWDAFANAHGNYTVYYISIGLVGAGYDDTYQNYNSNYTKDIGLNNSLSRDFTEESDPFNDTRWGGHTTDVGDTAAYMLKDGDTHPDMFTSLKVVSDSTGLTDENLRSALEHATKKGIDVLNMSFGIRSWSKCPSHYCSSLDSYTTGGGVPAAAVDNTSNNSKVEYPACSWHTVGTGGVQEKDSNGNVVAESDTEYGHILFKDPFSSDTYCPWCYDSSGVASSFSPEVYAVSQINTDSNDYLSGTSFARPQVAAGAWLNFADGSVNSYSDAMSKFKNMNSTQVVNNDENEDAAEEGDLLEADYYF